MNKREYSKLIIDTTAIAIKAKLLQEQLKQTSTFHSEELSKAKNTLAKIELSLSQLQTAKNNDEGIGVQETLAAHKITLKTLTKDLGTIKANSEKFNKQFEAINKSLCEKSAFLATQGEVKEFDLSSIKAQTEQAKSALATVKTELEQTLPQVNSLKEKITPQEQVINNLSISTEVKKAVAKAKQLEKSCGALRETVANDPSLLTKESFTPLREALHALSLHEPDFDANNLKPGDANNPAAAPKP